MSNPVRELSSQLAAVVEAAAASVVRVEGRRRGPSSGVVWSADGVVVTASHVLEWDENVRVGLPDGGSLAAVVTGRDPGTDVAVLRLAAQGLRTPEWTEPAELKVGHLVVGLSRPGRAIRASLGMVSAVADAWRSPAGGRLERYVQTDLGRHFGFSGGLLADAEGRALGLNTTGLLRGASSAVAAPTLRRVVAALLAHGRVRRGYLGVGTFPVRLPASAAATLGQDAGLLLVSVEPDSPAGRAGLFLGDVVVSLDGQPVRHPGDLQPFLEEERIGTELAGRVLRTGELREVRIVVGPRER
jgi:S1-C subfamily serine protease